MRMPSSYANAIVAMTTYGLWQWKPTVQDYTGRLSGIIQLMPRSSMVLATSWIQMPCWALSDVHFFVHDNDHAHVNLHIALSKNGVCSL